MRVEVLGFRELDAALGELPKALRREVLLKALRKAGGPMVQEAKSRARRQAKPRRRGGQTLGSPMAAKWGLDQALAESITLSAVKPNPEFPGEVAVKLGPDAGHFYGLFVEKGTKASGGRSARSRTTYLRKSKKTGELKVGVLRRRKGKRPHAATRAFPYLEPAFAVHAERTASAIGEELWDALAAKAKSLAKNAEAGTLSKKAREALVS